MKEKNFWNEEAREVFLPVVEELREGMNKKNSCEEMLLPYQQLTALMIKGLLYPSGIGYREKDYSAIFRDIYFERYKLITKNFDVKHFGYSDCRVVKNGYANSDFFMSKISELKEKCLDNLLNIHELSLEWLELYFSSDPAWTYINNAYKYIKNYFLSILLPFEFPKSILGIDGDGKFDIKTNDAIFFIDGFFFKFFKILFKGIDEESYIKKENQSIDEAYANMDTDKTKKGKGQKK